MDLGDLIIYLFATLKHASAIIAPKGGFPDGVDLALRPRYPQLIAVLLIVVGSAHDVFFLVGIARSSRLYSVDRVLSALESRRVLDV